MQAIVIPVAIVDITSTNPEINISFGGRIDHPEMIKQIETKLIPPEKSPRIAPYASHPASNPKYG